MIRQAKKLISQLSITGMIFGLLIANVALPDIALAKEQPAQKTYPIVPPPTCLNYKGETVRFFERNSNRKGVTAGQGIAAGMANKDKDDKPVIYRSNYSRAPKEFQNFIDRHECAHHQTGDVDQPHPPRNGPKHLMNESICDCIAILRLRDEENYDQAGFDKVAASIKNDMSKIGFPEISISSRISNIRNCYTKYGAPNEYVAKVLKRRGLKN